MTDADDVAFAATFGKLRSIFPLRGDRGEIQQLVQIYFQVLRRCPLKLVQAGADTWLERGTRFPKPAEWLSAIPREPAADLPEMTPTEAQEYQRAAALFWEDDPCKCLDCQQAGVTHRMLRHVPDYDADERDVRMKLGDRVVVRGHWAHGEELKRWYAARDAFLALKDHYGPKLIKTMRPAVVVEQAEQDTTP